MHWFFGRWQNAITISNILLLLIALFMVSACASNTPAASETMTTATLETTKGIIVIELFVKEMPLTTGNFIKLADDGFYDGTAFHRVIPGFMIQGGDPLSKEPAKKQLWGTGGPGYTIKDEFVAGLSNTRGTIAMANTGQPNSGGSQFFINAVDNSFLDFDKQPLQSKHPVFGKVIEGMDVVDAIAGVSRDPADRPQETILIKKISIG